MKIFRRLLIGLIAGFLFSPDGLYSQENQKDFQNPILPGFHPDPSLCRVGTDYYLVNSTFEWYPGIPVYHSKDLVNWKLIGHGIHRPGQVELPPGLGDSRGVYAATIRYHQGIFYIINTCVNCQGNFYITATNPSGPWSDPVWLPTPGIDPSLFWDDDGKSYYLGHGNISGVADWPQKNGAWIQEIDLVNGKMLGKPVQLTHGHAANARWTEGPHIYKIEDRYLLLVAEGGTGFHHAVTVHESDSLYGPYVPNHANPVLTHRHLGSDYPVHSVGHADMVRTQNGEWWSLMLAKRKIEDYTLLSRETFMARVEFEEQEGMLTPVYNPGEGKLLMEQLRPDLPWTPVLKAPSRDEFNGGELGLEWNFLRTPYTRWYSLENAQLILELRSLTVDSLVNPSLIARRIEDHSFTVSTLLEFSTRKDTEQAGLIIYRRSTHHYQLLKGREEVLLVRTLQGKREIVARVPYKGKRVVLTAETRGLKLQFKYGEDPGSLKPIGQIQNINLISDELCGGFNGPYVGMYATANGKDSKNTAVFNWFEYNARKSN